MTAASPRTARPVVAFLVAAAMLAGACSSDDGSDTDSTTTAPGTTPGEGSGGDGGPTLTVQGNIELLAELHDIPKAERLELAADAIELVGLDGFEQHYPKSLSGGMKMRASLARSLVLQPDVFLFDEPFGALDEISRERLNTELLSLFKAKNFAGLFITHSIAEAVFLSTRVLVMSARPGQIIADYEVPFEYPREHDIRYDASFAELSGKISHDLRGAHE